jgi:hypothetical protein
MRAFRTNENMFQWFENPANKLRLVRFGMAMQGSAAEEPKDTIFRGVSDIPLQHSRLFQFTTDRSGFKWGELPAGSVIVDVGGGLGASSLSIAKKYPTLKIVNQDRGPVIEQSKSVSGASVRGRNNLISAVALG